jgi:hypothetical protein
MEVYATHSKDNVAMIPVKKQTSCDQTYKNWKTVYLHCKINLAIAVNNMKALSMYVLLTIPFSSLEASSKLMTIEQSFVFFCYFYSTREPG